METTGSQGLRQKHIEGTPQEKLQPPSTRPASPDRLRRLKDIIPRVPTERIAELQKGLVEVAKKPQVREIAAKAAGEVAAGSRVASDLVMRSRASRLRAEEYTKDQRGIVYHSAKTLLEMIPGGIGPYGVGDAITLVEGVMGRELGGRRLDLIDRLISLAAAAIPIVPATPFREAVRNFRIQLEESVARNVQQKPPTNTA